MPFPSAASPPLITPRAPQRLSSQALGGGRRWLTAPPWGGIAAVVHQRCFRKPWGLWEPRRDPHCGGGWAQPRLGWRGDALRGAAARGSLSQRWGRWEGGGGAARIPCLSFPTRCAEPPAQTATSSPLWLLGSMSPTSTNPPSSLPSAPQRKQAVPTAPHCSGCRASPCSAAARRWEKAVLLLFLPSSSPSPCPSHPPTSSSPSSPSPHPYLLFLLLTSSSSSSLPPHPHNLLLLISFSSSSPCPPHPHHLIPLIFTSFSSPSPLPPHPHHLLILTSSSSSSHSSHPHLVLLILTISSSSPSPPLPHPHLILTSSSSLLHPPHPHLVLFILTTSSSPSSQLTAPPGTKQRSGSFRVPAVPPLHKRCKQEAAGSCVC